MQVFKCLLDGYTIWAFLKKIVKSKLMQKIVHIF